MRDIPTLLATLRTNLRKTYGVNADMALIDCLIGSAISSKMMQDIDQVISGWTPAELIAGKEAHLKAISDENRGD